MTLACEPRAVSDIADRFDRGFERHANAHAAFVNDVKRSNPDN
ncbi:hypothetical protein IST4116A_05473 [Burkholderia cenocepacia]|nr:hypothetical protein IST4112_05474 [Burkholderia cenocepacia]CAB5108128.1 hypothetical protein IST4113_05482 [Burkholderia cenocepacia]CAB5131192.1 hypothetical protein IST4134_05484 [Burkholderia cenocepacia]CAB5133368.1 hypothetical protein IST4129_05484 [Burkholderia cenocepacia]CAB5134903.1 hypothetical protein IST4116B_05467 [Burkholderia cenocepacia]